MGFYELGFVVIVGCEKVNYNIHDKEPIDNLIDFLKVVIIELTLKRDVKRCYQTCNKKHPINC